MIRRPATILALLTTLNLLNYLDRLVVSAVLEPVQKELHLSNFVGGLLATVFLLGYFVTSPIFGALGDRFPRRGLVAAGVAIWSAATLASGFATSAGTLIAARVVVGVGEASYATLAPTIIDDIAPAEKKGRWLAIFYVASPVGAALGYVLGGSIAHKFGWRDAFFVAGGPGLLLAALCFFIHEPERRTSTKTTIVAAVRKLVPMRTYRIGVLGYCAYSAAVGAFSHWAPKFLVGRFPELDVGSANVRFGTVTVVAGAIGTAIGGVWADRMKKRTGGDSGSAPVLGGLLKICAVGSLLAAPLAAIAFLAPSANGFFFAAFACEVALFLSTSPINAVLLHAVPVELRASAMALAIFAIHLLGDLWSPAFVGWIADHAPMTSAMMTLVVAIGVSAAVWWSGASNARSPART